MVDYDITNPISIEKYSKRLIGHTFKEVIAWDVLTDTTLKVEEERAAYGNKSRKGGLGNLLEEKFYHYKANSESKPDFAEAGVELKVSPYEIKKDGALRAGERLVLSMIPYDKPIDSELHGSHLWDKCKLLLLIYYLRNKSLPDNLDYVINFAKLFTPTGADLKIIEQDYQTISKKIESGKAEELSEGDTLYLGACTKGQTAAKSVAKQYYPPHTLAKRRAFCYKQSFMTYVLNNYIYKDVTTYKGKAEPIVRDASLLEKMTFTELVAEKINRYVGYTDEELCKEFGLPYTANKAQWSTLAYRMLGIRSNLAEEFVKAGIKVKAIRLEDNGQMKESMSFPTFRYKDIINEEWEDSTVHNYFTETSFLFVVYNRKGSNYVLSGCQFWHMPNSDLEKVVRVFWEKVVGIIKDGVKFEIVPNGKNKVKVLNNFPETNDNGITHIRPHASKRYFRFLDGTTIGDEANKIYSNELPDGSWMPNYCFWLNREYIVSQIKDELKQNTCSK